MWTIKFLEDNIEENLGDFGYGDDFLDVKSKAQSRGGLIKWTSLWVKSYVLWNTVSRK